MSAEKASSIVKDIKTFYFDNDFSDKRKVKEKLEYPSPIDLKTNYFTTFY